MRCSFGKFKEVSSAGKQHNYTTDVTAENLWNKKIPTVDFTLDVFDKAKVRVGDGWISISDLIAGGVVKFHTFINASKTIASLELVPKSFPTELQAFLPPKTISITVNSVPQGAELKIDGTPTGTTPKIVQVTLAGVQQVRVQFRHFSPGDSPDDVSGGSVSYELGTSAHDTLDFATVPS